MKQFILGVALLLSSLVGRAQKAELTALLHRNKVPGIQVVHAKKSHVAIYNLGIRQSGTTHAVTATTTFQAASLGKLVLAYTALRLYDQGLFALDKPLLNYYPYPRLAGQPAAASITAGMVLMHSSGLPNWAENPLGATWSTSPLRLSYPPDSCWNYSGEGYVFLQKTLEHLTGKSFETLAQEEVFRPLRMQSSSFVWREEFASTACFGHDKAGTPTELRRFAEPNAGFSLLTNATDYNSFLQALMNGQGLKPATHHLLLTAASPANRCRTPTSPTDPYITWGYGIGLATTTRGLAQWHWGDNDDFQGFFMTLPAKNESVLFLTNSANGLKLTDEILRLFLGSGDYRAMQWLAEER